MFKTLLLSALVRRYLLLLLLSTAGWLTAVPNAQAQRRPTKRIPAAASPSADTTSGGASAAPQKAAGPANKATKPTPAARPTSPTGTYRVRGLNSRTSRKLRLRPDGTPDFVDINRYPYF